MLRNAFIFKFKRNNFVYKEGDKSDLMYVILKGSVNLVKYKKKIKV